MASQSALWNPLVTPGSYERETAAVNRRNASTRKKMATRGAFVAPQKRGAFDVRIIGLGAAATGGGAALVTLVAGVVAGFPWWLSAITSMHLALTFAIVGGWLAATFTCSEDE